MKFFAFEWDHTTNYMYHMLFLRQVTTNIIVRLILGEVRGEQTSSEPLLERIPAAAKA
jgi:uncharacterized membrane protein affecting hemolysin expression